jgi:thioredoxin 1
MGGTGVSTSIEELERRLADLKARMPAHSIPPSMMIELDELEEQLAAQQTAAQTDTSGPLAVTDAEFEAVVLDASVPVVVDFWAPWCMPCQVLAPVVEEVAAEYGGRVLVAKVNTDENSRWATHYGVRGIPTLLFIWKGHEAGRMVGVVPAATIKQLLEQML